MIFQLGKTKASAEASYEDEPRWRQPSFVRVDNDSLSEERIRAELEEEARFTNGAKETIPVEPASSLKPTWTAPMQAVEPRPNVNRTIDNDSLKRFGANVKTAIASGTVIEGRFSFDSPVRIDGDMTGEILSSSILIVGEQATVRARIKVGSIIVFGRVIGDIEAQDLVEIKNGGHLEANISTDRVAIEDGGYFKGSVNIG